MTPSQNCIDLIKRFEGFKPDAYLCPAGVPTIGYGSTMWSDGKKVQLGQKISMADAEKLLMWEVTNKSKAITQLSLNQNQFDALVSFAYNVGVGAINRSTLVKKAKLNPNDATIRDEFMRWTKAGGKELPGLVKRRKAEADLYFS